MKPLYSPRHHAYAASITKAVSRLRKPTSIEARLREMGFDFFGEKGSYKTVLASNKFPGLVVKVYKSQNGHKEDTNGGLKPEASQFFLTPIFQDGRIIIQREANHEGGKPSQARDAIQRALGVKKPYDLFSNNCAYHDGQPYFFDYCT